VMLFWAGESWECPKSPQKTLLIPQKQTIVAINQQR